MGPNTDRVRMREYGACVLVEAECVCINDESQSERVC